MSLPPQDSHPTPGSHPLHCLFLLLVKILCFSWILAHQGLLAVHRQKSIRNNLNHKNFSVSVPISEHPSSPNILLAFCMCTCHCFALSKGILLHCSREKLCDTLPVSLLCRAEPCLLIPSVSIPLEFTSTLCLILTMSYNNNIAYFPEKESKLVQVCPML